MPLPSPVPSRRCTRKGTEALTKVDMPAPEAASITDWSELPLDALASIFVKLGAIEILMGAGLVCRSWLQAAKLPDLWRSVDMAHHKVLDEMDRFLEGVGFHFAELGLSDDDLDDAFVVFVRPKINAAVLRAMARVAVDRSGGQLEEFFGKRFVTDELLMYLAERSPALKGIRLISCGGVTNQGFTEFISKCPMIEDLQLMSCRYVVFGSDVFKATSSACAQLKRFMLVREGFEYNSGEANGVAAMHELRSLTLQGISVCKGELESILDGCPHLELLDLSGCINIDVEDGLQTRLSRIKSLTLPSYD